ncbi:MAG: hypothetical protein JNM42_14940 [Propionivibrio sp.]|uniref:alginate O-acetyltransferase AlgX-related protein n=1 Tax=Propionivibrio sp. TaxID=2212460 RepID=UPI001A5FC57F|nr:hypothetical protein [Propionivibrio sp.]MBL8415732.1 hypothetical protein [Propionivibrio sp.]
MNISHIKPAFLYVLALLLSFHALLFYGFPRPVLFAVWLLMAITFLFAGGAQAMLSAMSLAVFTLLLNAVIHFSGLESSIYYRPHELMKSSNPDFGEIYKPDTQFSMNALFGDIEAIEKAGVKEPHEIAYLTDSLGFRNPSDYHGQNLVLVGDSFVAGANDTQSCLISEWLRQSHNLDSYNLGFPGDMNDYVNRVRAFRRLKGNDFRMALFVYEGNDFIPFTNKPVTRHSRFDSYYGLFKSSSLWRYTRSLYLRGQKKRSGEHAPPALVQEIGGKPVAFYSKEQALINNRSKLKETDLNFVSALQILKPNLVEIFFVPVKYRVYAQWLPAQSLPNEQWNYLAEAARQAGIPVHDLTPVLSAEAARLLTKGHYVYWRDDTHWNCNGMRVAAAEVARILLKQ